MYNNKIIREDFENIYKRDILWEQLNDCAILITGAYGMLASYLVYFLLYLQNVKKKNITLLLQGRLIEKFQAKFGKAIQQENVRICNFSINEPITVDTKVDYIFHAASLANPSYYGKVPIEVAEPNAIGTYYLLKFAAECHAKGFLYFSSGDVYGKVAAGEVHITEDTMGTLDPLAIRSCYSESKRMGENWCASFWRERGVPAKIARLGHTYGPTMDIESDPRVFASFLKNVRDGQDISMSSDGMALRPFCYIADAIAAFFLILLKGNSGEAYNVCNTEQYISIGQLAETLVGLRPELNLKVEKKQYDVNPKNVKAVENGESQVVTDKLKALGWACEYAVTEGFSRTLDYLNSEIE